MKENVRSENKKQEIMIKDLNQKQRQIKDLK